MKTFEVLEGATERKVLTALITNTQVLASIVSIWDGKLFAAKVSNLLGSWCVDYFKQHAKAPSRAIETIFVAWAEAARDKELIEQVERCIQSMQDEYEETLNADHLLAIAAKLFRKVRLSRILDESRGLLDVGQLEQAESLVSPYQKPEIGVEASHFLPHDEQDFLDAFKSDYNEALTNFKGDLGVFLNPLMIKNGLVALIAPSKSAKSFWLQEIGLNLLWNRKRVAYLCVGDMTKTDLYGRMGVRVAAHPLKAYDGKWPCKVQIPTLLYPPRGDGGLPSVQHRTETFYEPVTGDQCLKAMWDSLRTKTKSLEKYFNVNCYPADSISWLGIKAHLEKLEAGGFIPDAIILDYADLLSPEKSFGGEVRHQINDTWKGLSNLRMERHCLLVTATQSDASGYNAWVLDKKNFNNDRRINDHVTALVGINSTEGEKEAGVVRLKVIHQRNGRASSRQCYVAGCLDLANPAVLSAMYESPKIEPAKQEEGSGVFKGAKIKSND